MEEEDFAEREIDECAEREIYEWGSLEDDISMSSVI